MSADREIMNRTRSRSLAMLLVLAVVAAACSSGPSLSAESATDEGPAAADQEPVPEIVEDAPSPEPGPLLVNLTIHAEGWLQGPVDPAVHDFHLDGVMALARTAAEHGAILSIDLDTHIVAAMSAHGTEEALDEILALGHDISVHADFGGQGNPSLAVFTSELERQRDELGALGITTTNISGICSRGPWVEAALAAGFDTVTGLVSFCMTSLDPAAVPVDARAYVSQCQNPAQCHDAIQVPVARRLVPWVADSSGDWLTPAGEGLTLIASESASGIHCPNDTGCTIGGGGIDVLTDWLDQYVDLQVSTGQQGVLALTWSIGGIPEPGFADELFSAIDPYVARGDVQWGDIEEIKALV